MLGKSIWNRNVHSNLMLSELGGTWIDASYPCLCIYAISDNVWTIEQNRRVIHSWWNCSLSQVTVKSPTRFFFFPALSVLTLNLHTDCVRFQSANGVLHFWLFDPNTDGIGWRFTERLVFAQASAQSKERADCRPMRGMMFLSRLTFIRSSLFSRFYTDKKDDCWAFKRVLFFFFHSRISALPASCIINLNSTSSQALCSKVGHLISLLSIYVQRP